MDFYLDENLPKLIAQALNIIEQHDASNKVFSTEVIFGKGVKDCPLITKLKEVNGIWITHDSKIITRKNEFQLIKNEGIKVIIIGLPDGCKFTVMYRTIFDKWENMKTICKRNGNPFVCKIHMNGTTTFYD